MMGIQAVKPTQVSAAIDMQTMMALLGLMIISNYFEREKFFEFMGRMFLKSTHSPYAVLLRFCAVAAVLSALFTNGKQFSCGSVR